MADSILKLRVESQEYDNKLKRAAEGIQRYAEQCRKAGGTLEHLDDGVEEFVRALGQMETVSKSVKGNINEMTKAFTDLSIQYNKLTDEEKNAPFGQALKVSLDELKGRIQAGNTEINNISESLNGGGGLKDALNQVAGKFGLNIDMVTKFGGVIGVTTTALKVIKDAFFQSESNIDEWGRTIKGAEGAYDIFLQTLNNGNWSNFFSNLETAIRGGRDLYDVFDRLNSIKANNAVAIAATQAEIQQLRLLKQQGQDVDDKIKAATARLAALQSQSANAGINAGKSQIVNSLRNGVNSIGGAYINDATLNRAADNISKQGQAYFDFMKRRAADLERKGMVTRTQTISDSQGGTYERQYRVFDINALSKEQQKQYAIAKVITERETEIQKGLSVWAQSVNEQTAANREEFKGNRYALTGGGTTPRSTFDVSKIAFTGGEGVKADPDQYFQSVWAMIGDQGLRDMLGIGKQQSDLGKILKEYVADPDSKKRKELNAKADATIIEGFSAISNSIGGIFSGIEALGIEIPSGLKEVLGGIQAVASILTGISALVSVITTIQGVKSTPIIGEFLAGGGIAHAANGFIGGNTFSGDQIPIMVNAGELILNRAQQGNLASQLQGGGMGNLQLEAVVRGEDLRFIINSNGRRTGRGEIVTTNFR